MADESRRTTPREQLRRDQSFDDISPDVGQIDEQALAELVEEDADHALSLLAEMTAATDPLLAALAARLAGRLMLDVARSGPSASRGIGRMVSSPADRADGDLDIDASLDALVHARAGRSAVAAEELRVRHWTKPTMALSLLVDRSGSMSGDRLAIAAVAAAACSWRAPADWSVLGFSERQLALKSQDDDRSPAAVVNDLLRLRGRGTTDLDAALRSSARQLERSRARRRVTILLSDCRATAGVDPVAAARRLDELCIIAPADDAEDAADFARRVGARFAMV
ncbi:MAG TPA: vWA domain-containing protein, partial [Acidimicrobiia bacterium]|nr:vWA domain-containing protein [Acidimicrobiia bacterium]